LGEEVFEKIHYKYLLIGISKGISENSILRINKSIENCSGDYFWSLLLAIETQATK
jgi:hypothetical protein